MGEESCAATEVWTIGLLLRWTTEYLSRAGVDEPRLSAELLLSHALGCAKIELYTRFDQEPTDQQRVAFRELVRQAAEHKPVAYLVGHKEFYSLDFAVTPEVLIPRPETEVLVERAIACCQASEEPQVHLLDMGTGSGCIAVAILSQVAKVRAVGSDVSATALAVARHNAETHQVADRLRLVQADRLNLPEDCVPSGGFDLIVSNPPYVAQRDMESLPRNVGEYEPRVALLAGADGLTFYRTLGESGPSLLKPGGALLVEIGAGMADAVHQVMESGEAFEHSGTWRDASGSHPRVMQFVLRQRRGTQDRN